MEVRIIRRKGRRYWTARWVDPLTGKRRERSTKATTRREAERAAMQLEAELEAGSGGGGPMAWPEFRLAYFREYVVNLRRSSKEKIRATFNVLEDLVDPRWATFTARDVGRFAAALREPYTAQDGETLRRRSPATIRGHLVNLQTALRWAKRQGIITTVPDFNLPRKTATPHGRAVTVEELERMTDATVGVVGPLAADSWAWLLRGLFWSGLRLGEAVALSWDHDAEGIRIDWNGRWPMFRIPASADKGRKNRIFPIAPEFAAILEAIPEHQRRGRVFKPLHRDGTEPGRRRDWVGRIVREIGAAANVVTGTNQDGTRRTASAHDFRRSFGTRWAARILPQHLQELMRHEDIKTTMEFYVSQNAEATAAAVWAAFDRFQNAARGGTLGDTSQSDTTTGEPNNEKTP